MNNPIGWHMILRAEDGRRLFGTPRERRIFATAVVSACDPHSLAAFDAAEDHGHLALLGPREVAGRISRVVKNSLSRKLALPCSFLAIEPSPIRDRSHAIKTFRYVLGQRTRHGLSIDPLREGSILPDLFGYRLLLRDPWQVLRRFQLRIAPEELLTYLGGLELRPGADLRLLLDSVDSIAASLRRPNRDPLYLSAMLAAVHIGYELGATTSQIAGILRLSCCRIRALRGMEAEEAVKRAIRLQMGLREQIGIRVDPR